MRERKKERKRERMKEIMGDREKQPNIFAFFYPEVNDTQYPPCV